MTTPNQPQDMCNRNWTEDESHENGSYQNTCIECRKLFMGHKRRVVCKSCATDQPASEPEKENTFKGFKVGDVLKATVGISHVNGPGCILPSKLARVYAASEVKDGSQFVDVHNENGTPFFKVYCTIDAPFMIADTPGEWSQSYGEWSLNKSQPPADSPTPAGEERLNRPNSAGWWTWYEADQGRGEDLLICEGGTHVVNDDEWHQFTGKHPYDPETGVNSNYWEGTETTQEMMPGKWEKKDVQPPTPTPPEKVDTPRTDAVRHLMADGGAFARTLERELIAAREEIAELKWKDGEWKRISEEYSETLSKERNESGNEIDKLTASNAALAERLETLTALIEFMRPFMAVGVKRGPTNEAWESTMYCLRSYDEFKALAAQGEATIKDPLDVEQGWISKENPNYWRCPKCDRTNHVRVDICPSCESKKPATKESDEN